MQDGVGTTNYSYWPIDPTPVAGAGRLREVTGPVLANGASSTTYVTDYSYDPAGRLIGRTVDGAVESYGYDGLSRLSTLANILGSFTYQWDGASNRLSQMALTGGLSEQYSYFGDDKDRLLSGITHFSSNGTAQTARSMAFDYDGAARITQFSPGVISPQTTWDASFNYTARNELASAAYAVTTISTGTSQTAQFEFTFDSTGNRTTEAYLDGGYGSAAPNRTSLPAGNRTTNGTFNDLNQIISNDSPRQFHFDANGNRDADYNGSGLGSYTTASDYREYSWDAENRLISWTHYTGSATPAASSVFVYDGLGRRIAEKTNGQILRQWVWNGDEIAEERNGAGIITKRYFPQGFQRLMDGTKFYYVRDHLGSIWEAVDRTGTNTLARYNYDPYGRRYLVAGKDSVDFGYTGHYYHSQSGLLMTRFRMYSANDAAWLSRDPIGENGGSNLYGYAGNDPINYFDPLGLDETFWWPDHGRGLLDGPRNGNWGGKNWSGGKGPNEIGPDLAPTDSGDALYMQHDRAYDAAKCSADIKEADATLVSRQTSSYHNVFPNVIRL
jgi:RHS repeat-associated protein